MDIQTITDTVQQFIITNIHQVMPNMQVPHIRYALAGALGLLAALLAISAIRLLRGTKKKNVRVSHTDIPRQLQHGGRVIDLLNSNADEDVAVRLIVTSASARKIKCEIVERLDVIKTSPGKAVRCVFAPIGTDKGKVNSFTAKLIQSDTSGGSVDRVILSAPTGYAHTPRRKHGRKRVADQQFIRVKLWVDNPYASDIAHQDASPHIGVNSFNQSDEHTANAVVNISNGGLAISVQNNAIPETCAVGATVAINLAMFSFKDKAFKPYWYSGEVRSMEEATPGFTRMGLAFNGNGQLCDETGKVRWARF